ncbi:MAG TPA: flagellar basal body L-ring protein FlgH [Steroidobacter sp.]|jgi:flagellar L-ring protein precursor FlgH|nr:flagellar basal body L-ring protein FlgH [Steroidobacteraceae bacterium]HLS81621.1 flagellar basal body L-ring protein FlgH [Steroidobacter sp.]
MCRLRRNALGAGMRRSTPTRALSWAPVLAAALLSGCSAVRPVGPAPLEESEPLAAHAPKGEAGGVFSTQAPWTLVSDSRAFRPGDVLTVVLQETTQAKKSADTSFAKRSGVTIPPAVFGGDQVDLDVSLSAARDFNGSATSTQQNALQGAITVIVREVLPNGLLRVSGEKSLYLNQGEEFIRLSGYVRATDIDRDNRISSLRVANARIAYSGRGTLNNSNSPGWLTRFFSGPWMPF